MSIFVAGTYMRIGCEINVAVFFFEVFMCSNMRSVWRLQ